MPSATLVNYLSRKTCLFLLQTWHQGVSRYFFNSRTGQIVRKADMCFPYYFRTGIKKGLGRKAKSLISLCILVGGASFELATPAV